MLYIDDFEGLTAADLTKNNLAGLRAEVFPYAGNPYAIFKSDTNQFYLSRIAYVPSAQATSDNLHEFCSDSGLILAINAERLFDLVSRANAEILFDLAGEDGMENWPKPLEDFNGQAHLFYTSEINSGFAGGGSFRIE
ncbi:hypothetical protein [Hymenobacter koreensis]|uniref:hypothetical protein n=1 Tax=Hymenobacter koreensis TaxID=1084523 RepID=UPI0031EF9F7D